MAFENFLTRFVTPIAKAGTKDCLASHHAPPAFGDIVHDGLVSSGQTWGGIFGGAVGTVAGEMLAGPYGAAAGGLAGTAAGAVAGGWAGHGAYRQGQVINNILTHPSNWTVDAAGAIVPVMEPNDARPATGQAEFEDGMVAPLPPPSRSTPLDNITAQPNAAPPPWQTLPPLSAGTPQARHSSLLATRAPPVAYLPPAPQDKAGGILGMLIDAGHFDPANPDRPAPGGLPGFIQEYLRNNPSAGH